VTSRSAIFTSLALAFGFTAITVAASKAPVNADRQGIAIRGYDPVAYVVSGRATKGLPEFQQSWNGATWRFATAANRDMFARDPEKYAPQFGGYCSWAVSRGYTADIDPEAWRIVDGRLYLNYSKQVQRMWEKDIPGNIARARSNWPGVLQ
jgi:YHS domain-containing protein